MKITKRLREEAARACQIAASNDWWNHAPIPSRDTPAGMLAWAVEGVTWAVWRELPHWTPEAHWAEAEALLRTGYVPEGWEE